MFDPGAIGPGLADVAWLHARGIGYRTGVGEALPGRRERRIDVGAPRAPHQAPAPGRLGRHPPGREVPAGHAERVRPRSTDARVPGAAGPAAQGRGHAHRPEPARPQRAGARHRGRPDVGASGAGRRLHLLLGLRHGDGAGRVRQLRLARRLRPAEDPGRLGEGSRRRRPLRPQPSRREGAHRAAGRRPGAGALQRSGRRRRCQGSGVAGWLLARSGHAAARQRQTELVLARRSAHPRSRRDGRRPSPRPEGSADAAEDSRRRPQRARGDARARGPGRTRAAGGVRQRHRRRDARRSGTGRAQRRGRHGPGRAPDLRRRRLAEGHADAGADRAPRYASRRVDLRRRRSRYRHDCDARTGPGARPTGEGRLAAAAHHLAGVLGRRGVRTGRLDRVRRGVQGAAPGAARHVREHRHVHEGALRSRRRAVAAGVRRRRREGRPGRQQQRLRPVAAVRMDAPAAVARAPGR